MSILKSILLLALLLLFVTPGWCQIKPVTFAWQQELPAEGDFSGWKFYNSWAQGGPYTYLRTVLYLEATYLPIENEYRVTIDIDNSSNTDNWYFVVTAFDTSNNESSFSNEAHGQFLPPDNIDDFNVTKRP